LAAEEANLKLEQQIQLTEHQKLQAQRDRQQQIQLRLDEEQKAKDLQQQTLQEEQAAVQAVKALNQLKTNLISHHEQIAKARQEQQQLLLAKTNEAKKLAAQVQLRNQSEQHLLNKINDAQQLIDQRIAKNAEYELAEQQRILDEQHAIKLLEQRVQSEQELARLHQQRSQVELEAKQQLDLNYAQQVTRLSHIEKLQRINQRLAQRSQRLEQQRLDELHAIKNLQAQQMRDQQAALLALQQQRILEEAKANALAEQKQRQQQQAQLAAQHSLNETQANSAFSAECAQLEEQQFKLMQDHLKQQEAFVAAERDKLANLAKAVELANELTLKEQEAAHQAELTVQQHQSALDSMLGKIAQHAQQTEQLQSVEAHKLQEEIHIATTLSKELFERLSTQQIRNKDWVRKAQQVLEEAPVSVATMPKAVYKRVGAVMVGIAMMVGVSGTSSLVSSPVVQNAALHNVTDLKMSYVLGSR